MSVAVRRGLYAKLTGTPAITSLLSTADAVYHGEAPESADYPYVILSEAAGSWTRAMGDVAFETEIWMVKAVDRAKSSDRVEAISEAVEDALTNGSITIAGSTLHDLFPDSIFSYLETEGDQTYRHRGVNYRIVRADN